LGVKDSDALHAIYEKAKTFCKENDLPYSFKVDNGDYETAIEFFYDDEKWHTAYPPIAKNWDSNPTIFCPDILDYSHKLVIEFDEEGQKRLSGAHLARKGHGPEGDILNKRDSRRGDYYSWGKFRVLRFYEADLKEENWEKLYSFLSC